LSDGTTSLASPPDGTTPATRVVSATLSLGGFVAAWPHCQHVADFLARFAASDRYDPEQLTTRLATYLHEVLELVCRSHADGEPEPGEAADLVVAVHRNRERLELTLTIPGPAGAGPGERLRRGVRRLGERDLAAAYRDAFTAAAAGEVDDGAGLLELVALHGITVSVVDAGDAVALTLAVPHE
jgi:hypothetical protein